MFEAFLGFDMLLTLATLVFWTITIGCCHKVAFSTKRHRLWTRLSLIAMFFSIFISILWFSNIATLWISVGWDFAADRVLLIAPILLLSILSVLIGPYRRLKQLTKEKQLHFDEVERKEFVYSNKTFLPLYTVVILSAISFYSYWFHRIPFPSIGTILIWYSVATGIIALASVLHYWKLTMFRKRNWSRPTIGLNLLSFVAKALILLLVITGWTTWGSSQSTIPAAMGMDFHHNVDFGIGKDGQFQSYICKVEPDDISVQELVGTAFNEIPDRIFTMEAQKKTVQLASGKTIESWTYNGEIGPEIKVKQGEVIEVRLLNKDIESGVTIHWHGYDVPNAMDGVPGMTQDAVMPGDEFIYRFKADEVGTHWFHSHQQSSEQVKNGLFGSFIVEAKDEENQFDEDLTLLTHTWTTSDGEVTAFGSSDELQSKQITSGDKVRVRLANTDNFAKDYVISGTSFKVIAIDGETLHNPQEISEKRIEVSGAGRYDISFTMPENPVRIGFVNKQKISTTGLLLNGNGTMELAANVQNWPRLNPGHYGEPQDLPFDLDTVFNREFYMIMDNVMDFYDGKPSYVWQINGEVFPRTPTFMVEEGDLAKMTFVNRSFMDHPMHLHGHHILVLSKNGKPLETPWWADTLNVKPGEEYTVAFRADNPGMWMNHCHNLDHANFGMTLHVSYINVTSPYQTGKDTPNNPH